MTPPPPLFDIMIMFINESLILSQATWVTASLAVFSLAVHSFAFCKTFSDIVIICHGRISN